MGMRQREDAIQQLKNNAQTLVECFLLETRKPKLNRLESLYDIPCIEEGAIGAMERIHYH